MAFAHDGRLLNIKSSDMAKYQSTSFTTGNNVSPKIMYRINHASSGNTAYYGGGFNTTRGRGFSNTHGPNGHRFTNANDNAYTGNPGVTANNPLPMNFASTTARPRSNSTNSVPTATVSSMPMNLPDDTISGRGSSTTNSNIKFSELAGISANSIPTDVCENARGLHNSPGNSTSVWGPTGGTSTTGSFVISKGSGNNQYSSYQGATASNLAYTVLHTMATNTWIEVKLNTVAAFGDMIVVYAVSAGGTMYTFPTSGSGPIYLRTPTGGSVSGATIDTYLAPNKNSTGTDTWNAGYYATVGAGGNVGIVGVNPYRSTGTYVPTIFHIFVIKRGTVAYGTSKPSIQDSHTKYNGGSNATSSIPMGTESDLNGGDGKQYARLGGTYLSHSHGLNMQAFNITIATTPFTSGGNFGQWSSSTSSHSGMSAKHDMAFSGCGNYETKGGVTGRHGIWSVTIDNYTGYYYYASGKYGTVPYDGSGTSNYTPYTTWAGLDDWYAVHAFTAFR